MPINSRAKGARGERQWRDELRAAGVIFDDADVPPKWTGGFKKDNGGGKTYVVCYSPRPDRRVEYMHRIVSGAEDGEWVDHINGNTLDNRLDNLRRCTPRQNSRNRGVQRNSSTGRKGVIWNKRCGKFQARINIGGKVLHLGLFTSLDDASKAYSKASEQYFGEFHHANK